MEKGMEAAPLRFFIKSMRVLIIFLISIFSATLAFAQDIKIYNRDFNLKYRVEGSRVYDKYWNLQYRIEDNKIYDKDWDLKFYIEGNRIYDRNWNLRYRKEGNSIYDKGYNHRYRLGTQKHNK